MSFLTFTYYVTGRNQLFLIEKLKKKGVNLKKIEIIDTKRLKITIFWGMPLVLTRKNAY